MPNYWVVGTMWGGHDDQSDKFIRRGYWFLGWSETEQPARAKRRDQIRSGDRIAIKRMLGQGSPNIEIRALGVVREIDDEDKRVYIDWLVRDVNREVAARGCFQPIHGPFVESDQWPKEVFRI
jgi:hypothetical protein